MNNDNIKLKKQLIKCYQNIKKELMILKQTIKSLILNFKKHMIYYPRSKRKNLIKSCYSNK